MAATNGTTQANEKVTSVVASKILPTEYYQRLLSESSKRRVPSPIWDLFSVELEPGMISMLAGKPNPVTFPFESITLGVRSPGSNNEKTVTQLVLQGEELDAGLQYGLTAGIPALRQWITDLTKHFHLRGDSEGWRVSIGSGSQDILYKAFSAILNPGDSVIVEIPTYPGIVPILQALKCNAVEVSTDVEGVSALELSSILESWDYSKPFPKALYTVPFGSNPTGLSTSENRRREILALAQKYNFLIFEDDPYYFLYYGSAPKPASYFTLEKSSGGELGRVLRFDSFSKVMAAGFRVGWATGPSRLLDAIELHSTSTTVQPSSISQAMILKLLTQWGLPGFIDHTHEVADFYRRKRDYFEGCLQRHLTGMAEWTTPEASMFYWLTLFLPPSDSSTNGEGDSTSFIRHKAIGNGVLILPGQSAYMDNRQTTCARVSFSLLDEEELEEAVKRLAATLKKEWKEYNARVKAN